MPLRSDTVKKDEHNSSLPEEIVYILEDFESYLKNSVAWSQAHMGIRSY